MGILVGACVLVAATLADGAWFQSHRGGMNEVPENTLVALEHSWAIPGAIPEVDLRTTADGIIICLHDETVARTATDRRSPMARQPVATLTWEDLETIDIGERFDPAFAGAPIPRLEEVFEAMAGDPTRRIWLDIKAVDLDALERMIDAHGLRDRALFVDGSVEGCRELNARFPEAVVMTWCSGDAASIRACYEAHAARGFEGITMLQFHLRAEMQGDRTEPVLGWDFLEEAFAETAAQGVTLQVRPFDTDARLLAHLLQRGIRWFVTDDPKAFRDALDAAGVSETQAGRPRGRGGCANLW